VIVRSEEELDRQHVLDRRRIELERPALAAADLDDPAAEAAHKPAAQLLRGDVGPALLAPLEQACEPRLPRAVKRRLTH
jgi:hypothetical protein